MKVGIVLSLSALELSFLWTAPVPAKGRSSAVGLSQPGSRGTPKALGDLGNLACRNQMSLPLFSHTFTVESIIAAILSS